jgi:alpha-glucosidase
VPGPASVFRHDDGAVQLRPHHDGSAAYVDTPHDAVVATPDIGSTTRVRVVVPHAAGVDAVHVRAVEDGEPIHRPATRVGRRGASDVYEAEVHQVNPTQRYRFELDGAGGTRWLTQAGVVDHEVPDTWDFALGAQPAPPAWIADAALYQIFPDRFARGGSSEDWPDWAQPAAWDDPVVTAYPGSMQQLYGGDLRGIVQRVDHLDALGVTGIYLTPIFPSIENHRYAAAGFDTVDPFLGGDDGLAELAAALHARGLKLIGDLTLNHSGATHPWFLAAQADPSSEEAGYYHFVDHPDRYHAWQGVASLPKFDHRDPGLRAQLYEGPGSVAARYLEAPFHLDGWRIDAANMAGRQGATDLSHELQRTLLATMRAVGTDRYLLAEHCHDATADLQGDGWHGTMDYAGFTRPVWSWLAAPERDVHLLGGPAPVRRRGGAAVARMMDLVRGQVPWRSVVHGMTLLGSHDTLRWAFVAGDRARRHVGLTWLLTFVGVPSLFYGDEVGLGAAGGVAHVDAGDVLGAAADGAADVVTRLPMPWDEQRWDPTTLALTRRLLALRRGSTALRRGGMRWVHLDDDVIVFLREHPRERILVALTRAAAEPVQLDAAVLDIADCS